MAFIYFSSLILKNRSNWGTPVPVTTSHDAKFIILGVTQSAPKHQHPATAKYKCLVGAIHSFIQ